MQQRIVVRYLTGSRANESDVLTADGDDLIAGRDPLASIHFDPEQDDLVSRQHLKITQDPNHPGTFRLVDLESRNGTFVNGRRVYGSTFLSHNDRVQLGPSGPEFQFELDPPPSNGTGFYPSGSTAAFGPGAKTAAFTTKETYAGYPTEFGGAGPSRPIGRATVERMLDDTFGLLKQESTKGVVVGLLCIAAVLIVGLGTWMYLRRSAMEATLAQRENQVSIERATREMQKVREDAKQQQALTADALKQELQRSAEANRKELQSMSDALKSIRKNQAAEIARQKQILAPGSSTAGAASQSPATFSQLVTRVDSLFTESKYAEAATVANQLIQLDPNRYEGYFFGGVSALEQKQTLHGKELLTQALSKAPLDRQRPIQELLGNAAQPK